MRVTYMSVVVPSHAKRVLRSIRKKRRYSLRDVTKLTGIGHSQLSRIENGADISARALIALTAFIRRHA